MTISKKKVLKQNCPRTNFAKLHHISFNLSKIYFSKDWSIYFKPMKTWKSSIFPSRSPLFLLFIWREKNNLGHWKCNSWKCGYLFWHPKIENLQYIYLVRWFARIFLILACRFLSIAQLVLASFVILQWRDSGKWRGFQITSYHVMIKIFLRSMDWLIKGFWESWELKIDDVLAIWYNCLSLISGW